MSQRTIPWGTVIAGTIALGTAVLVGLTEVAGVSISLGSAGPGVIIVVGVLILLAGLFVVLRSGRAARARAADTDTDTTDDAPHATTSVSAPALSPPEPTASSPLDVTLPLSTTRGTPPTTAVAEPDVTTSQSSH